ncbi:MAG: hypothetical protein C5B59_20275 [Bacteroidetes bacterium]|nr:MAG: hypothetical protein C5B59_20275 [Bacteroidota bacterium]
MKNEKKQLKKVTHIYDEESKQYLPIVDRIDEFKKKSKPSSAARFKENRKEKIRVLKKLKVRNPPSPGGVGYGVYYHQSFQWRFTNFSCLDFGILIPETAGGNSENYLYLTATNGTAHGVEALASYNGQEEPYFKIFDWAKPEADRWSLSIAFSKLAANASTVNINGKRFRYCRILNRTEMLSPGIWENKVCLFNFQHQNWDLVYNFQYSSELEQQKDNYQGSWGPIIECFQENYQGLNPMGFYKAMLYNDAHSPKLTVQNTRIRNDDEGIELAYIDKNWVFYVS